MADQILPHTVFEIATRIEEEANNLKVAISLMNEALQFRYSDAESAGLAQSQMFFLAGAVSDLQKRLEVVSAAAYDVHRTEKAAA